MSATRVDVVAPVVLFVYSRPEHTRRTLSALKQNELAEKTDLIVYADDPRGSEDQPRVDAVRTLVREATGFHSVTIIERGTNYGLARNIIEGATEVCGQHGRAIVLEDDLVTSPWFLTYMNQGLECYADDERVASIHGYCCSTKAPLPETFFLRGADCWGWATWSRAWKVFNPDGAFLLDELKRRRLAKLFDFNGTFACMSTLEDQVAGRNDSWAIRWSASAFLANMLTLYPARSLVQNIGYDFSGEHSGGTRIWDVQLSVTPIRFERIPIEDSATGRKGFEAFFRQNLPRPSKLKTIATEHVRPALSRLARQLGLRNGS